MKTELVKVGNGWLEALRANGRGWVVIKRVCDSLGIADRAQRSRLERATWAICRDSLKAAGIAA